MARVGADPIPRIGSPSAPAAAHACLPPPGGGRIYAPCPSARYASLRISSSRLTVRWNSNLPSPAG